MARNRTQKKLLGNHQKAWLWGRHPVLECLRAGKWLPIELRLSKSLAENINEEIRTLASSCHVETHLETDARLKQLCKANDHQGCLARMPEYPYDSAESLIDSIGPSAAFVILDGVQDPFNLGAILRSADVFGLDGVFLASTGQVGITSRVARSSAGAVNHLPIARVDGTSLLIERLRAAGVRIDATVPGGATPVHDVDFDGPVAVVIGNEAHGLSDETRRLCDTEITIQQSGTTESLNAAVAAGVLFYEIARQREIRR